MASAWPDRVERITGVPARAIVEAAHILGEAATAIVLTARGTEQQSQGVNNVLAFINLVLALGKAGRPGSGWGCLTGQGNGQGGREHGQKSDQLPGYRKLDNPEHRAWIASVWGVEADDAAAARAVSATELLRQARRARSRALLVLGANPVVSAPNVARVRRGLAALDLLVVFDFFLSETAELADVVLPVPAMGRGRGHDDQPRGPRPAAPAPDRPPGRRARRHRDPRRSRGAPRAIPPVSPAAPETVFDELRRASAGGIADYAGMTYERILREDGIFWPCPTEGHPGTPRLFLDRFATPDGRARFHAVQPRAAGEEPTKTFPMFVTTGRLLAHYQSGAQTRRVPELAAVEPEPIVEIHPGRGRDLRARGRRSRARHDPARLGDLQGPADRGHPPRHAVPALSLGRAPAAPTS